MTPSPATAPRSATRVRLDLAGLHGSLSDPVLDSMNFLNEVVSRFPDAISFAPGRPYDGLLDPARITEYLTASHKRPRALHRLPALPRTSSGKPIRNAATLAEALAAAKVRV